MYAVFYQTFRRCVFFYDRTFEIDVGGRDDGSTDIFDTCCHIYVRG